MAKSKRSRIKKKNYEAQVSINIEEFCANMELEVLYRGESETIDIATFNINRPGLQLAGYFDHFVENRILVIGEQETAFLKLLPDEERFQTLEKLFLYNFPCLVISTNLEPCKEILELAKKHNRIILRSQLRTTTIINELSLYINELLAPKISLHGVLVDLYGVGVLIIGESSVGKSEVALELIQRSHRLVADDAVIIKRVSNRLIGTSSPIIRYFMEVRGLGIIDIRSMYGAGAVKLTKVIDLVIKLEEWNPETQYDRLGNIKETYNILDLDMPMHTVPVKPGRNLAVILEVAARNYRLKSMGYDTLEELDKRVKNKKPEDDPFMD